MTVTCLVCDKEFDLSQAAGGFEDDENRWYFCSEHCRRQFDEEPEIYLGDDDLEGRGESYPVLG